MSMMDIVILMRPDRLAVQRDYIEVAAGRIIEHADDPEGFLTGRSDDPYGVAVFRKRRERQFRAGNTALLTSEALPVTLLRPVIICIEPYGMDL